MIVNTIAAVQATSREKFPTADIWIQAILPRLQIEEKVSQKISKINKGLFERFGIYFSDMAREFTTRNGKTRKDI